MLLTGYAGKEVKRGQKLASGGIIRLVLFALRAGRTIHFNYSPLRRSLVHRHLIRHFTTRLAEGPVP